MIIFKAHRQINIRHLPGTTVFDCPALGKELADKFLEIYPKSDYRQELLLDFENIPAALLISVFVNSFLQTIYDAEDGPERLEDLKNQIKNGSARFDATCDFEIEKLKLFLAEFKPIVEPVGEIQQLRIRVAKLEKHLGIEND